MNKQALFCDGSRWYVSPQEPDCDQIVTLRFRTAKEDVVRVCLVVGEDRYNVSKESVEGEFDYYSIDWKLGSEPFSYCFEISDKEQVCFFSRCGVSDVRSGLYDFKIVPGFSTPEWARGAVMYQIYTDRFYNGDKTNDVETNEYFYIGDYSRKVTDWNKYPDTMGVREFYGGDLQGVLDKLDYLQDLGIDPHFGVICEDGGEVLADGDRDNANATKYQKRVAGLANLEASNELFIKLVEELHRRGMKVILDGVFNHCGSFNKWMDRERIYENQKEYAPGAYVSAQSPYRSYFDFREDEEEKWPYNRSYDGWWSHDTLPKLNYEGSKELEEYILRVGQKWVSPPYNADGWRLDVAADLGHGSEYNHGFWKKFRKKVKEANPEALILAEHYGDPSSWLQGDEWDSVMNYDAFMEPLTWFLTGMEKHSDERNEDLLGNAEYFSSSMNHYMSRMLTPSLEVAMNELSNHDHSRFLTRTNHVVGRVAEKGPEAAEEYVNPAVMREAVVVQMTWVGAPTIYYGDEAGVCGFTDPDNRRTYPWGNENRELIEFHRDIIKIHRNSQALRNGSIQLLYGENNIIAYGRFTEDEQIVVIINNRSDFAEVTVPVWRIGVPMRGKMKTLMYSYVKGYTVSPDEYLVRGGELVVNMGAQSALVVESIR